MRYVIDVRKGGRDKDFFKSHDGGGRNRGVFKNLFLREKEPSLAMHPEEYLKRYPGIILFVRGAYFL